MPFMLSRICILRITTTLALLFFFAAVKISGQSADVRFPTPVDSNEILGAIPARDIGDARLTDHFYTFNGLPGDLLITVESKNINGDFDVFTAAELRPVLKVVVYAENSSTVTKNIYLRKPESLILRVEGKTPNDDEGIYRIRFSGTFAPVERSLIAESQAAEPGTPTTSRSGNRKTTRVTSAGARIDEPPAEIAAAPSPEPTPAAVEEPTSAVVKSPTPRAPRGRRPVVRKTPSKPAANTRTATADRASTIDDSAGKNTGRDNESAPAKAVESAAAPKTSASGGIRSTERRGAARSGRGNTRTSKPPATAENGQLIIEVKDGSRIEYAMSTVARVTIEGGEVVIVGNDGNVKRIPLSSVLRMSIGP